MLIKFLPPGNCMGCSEKGLHFALFNESLVLSTNNNNNNS